MKRLALAGLPALALAACVAAPPPKIATPAPVLPESFAYAPDAPTAGALEALLPYGDQAFADIAAIALEQAPTLEIALGRIDVARAGVDRAGANRLPRVSADASVTATRSNPEQFGGNLPPGVTIDTERVSYGANLAASWDPDLFGRVRAQERAASSRLDAATFEALGVRNALLAEIATAVIDWRALEARQTAIESDLGAAQELVRLSGLREKAGIAPGFDRVRAEGVADASRSRLAALESEKARITGRLVTLTGLPAQRILPLLAQPASLPAHPPAPAAMPSMLLANRPDVLAAAASLAAVDADLAATAAQRFPQFTLSAALGLLAFDFGSLFDEDAIVGSVGGGLLAPILDFGRIQAEIDGAAAEKRVAFARYRDSVFTALGEAETAYGVIAAADRELALAERELTSARRAADIAETRYRAGLSDFLVVLEARRLAEASAERTVAARGRSERSRVLLWLALGGDNDL